MSAARAIITWHSVPAVPMLYVISWSVSVWTRPGCPPFLTEKSVRFHCARMKVAGLKTDVRFQPSADRHFVSQKGASCDAPFL